MNSVILKIIWLLTGVLSLATNELLAQQACDNNKYPHINSSRFDINSNGTITDIESGLTWMRCAVGQNWNGRTCAGDALSITWDQAGNTATALNKNRNTEIPWRIPKLNELAGIADIRCKSPRIDLRLFPNTAAHAFWSANPTPDDTHSAYTLNFGESGIQRSNKNESHFLRLVRGRE